MSQTPHPPTARLRVVHLIKGLGPGGAERLIVNQLETADPAIDYTVLRLIEAKSHLVAEVERTGASTLLIGGGRLWPLALLKRLRTLAPNIVHAHSPTLAAVARIVAATTRMDTAVITTEHNRWPRHHPLTRLANRLTAPLDSRRIAVSRDVRDSMKSSLRESTTVIDHGVPVRRLAASRSAREEMRENLLGAASASLTVIGIVANFRPEKAYDVFLDACEQAIGQRDNIRFFVVGQGPGEDDFRRSVKARNLSEAVEVLGYRQDATEVMAAFDIFTLSSRHEGKPVSLMEAFALGVPVVATRAGGIPEAVTNGVEGILVDIGDAAGLASAWIRLVDDPELRERMAQAALSSAAHFDSSIATKSIESMYFELAG